MYWNILKAKKLMLMKSKNIRKFIMLNNHLKKNGDDLLIKILINNFLN